MTVIRMLLISLVVLAPAAQAGKLDDTLVTEGMKLLTQLRAKDIRTVGVLPFSVDRGRGPASRDFTPLATNLTTRLENALIFRQNLPGYPEVRVLRVPPRSAGRWDVKQADFNRLFRDEYPMAWGSKPARADGFLTGTVTLARDLKSAEVRFQVVKPDSWKAGATAPEDLFAITVVADPPLLRDLAYSAVTSRAWVPNGKKKQAPVVTPADIAGMKFEIRYDGKPQEIKPLDDPGAGPSAYGVVAPKPGEKVVFYLTRVAASDAGTLGAVIKVGGKSLYEEQDEDSLTARKWLFTPTMLKPEPFRGFYVKTPAGKLQEYPFAVLEKADGERPGARSGWIDVDVFVSRPEDDRAADGELLISTRGIGKVKPKSLAEARDMLAKVNRMRLPEVKKESTTSKTIELLKGSLPVVVPVTKGTFPNPVRAGGISIKFLTEQTKLTD